MKMLLQEEEEGPGRKWEWGWDWAGRMGLHTTLSTGLVQWEGDAERTASRPFV